MPVTVTSREFNQDAARAKRAAREGPVFITDRGRPAHVLMTVEEYRKLKGDGPSLVELLADDDGTDWEPPRMGEAGFGFKVPDFSE